MASPRSGAVANPLAEPSMFNEDELMLQTQSRRSDSLGLRPKVPWKAVSLALVLTFLGFVAIASGLFVGMTGSADREHGVSLLVVGSLMFIPGVYHTVIAYKAFMGRPGFSFSAFPDV